MVFDKNSTDHVGLLLYLESRSVDHGCRVDTRRMNEADMDLARRWDEYGFIRFGRIAFCDVTSSGSYWVELSDKAWEAAAALRAARGKRRWEVRTFKTTEDLRNG